MSNQPTMEKQKIIFSLGPLKITRCKDDDDRNKITEEEVDTEPMLLKYFTCSGPDLFCSGLNESPTSSVGDKIDAEKWQ
eukprot:scaffold34034_cov168-Skeletonema_marinoi.AAC.1